MNLIQEVESWHLEHKHELSKEFKRVEILSQKPEDPILGTIELRIETPKLLFTATFLQEKPCYRHSDSQTFRTRNNFG
jgi:hypothetical protein